MQDGGESGRDATLRFLRWQRIFPTTAAAGGAADDGGDALGEGARASDPTDLLGRSQRAVLGKKAADPPEYPRAWRPAAHGAATLRLKPFQG